MQAKKPSRATIYINNLTCIDHAFVNEKGMITGGSLHVDAYVTGPCTHDEKVVIDFSRVKKLLKHWIDAAADGFDHKLWFIRGYSAVKDFTIARGVVTMTSSAFSMRGPADAVKVFDGKTYKAVEEALNVHLEDKIKQEFPEVSVRCLIQQNVVVPDGAQASYFRYTHGLKDSSSYGCQNIAHGHYSYVALRRSEDGDLMPLVGKIASYLNGAIIINKANITDEASSQIRLAYTSRDRGAWSLVLRKDVQKLLVLPTETTVEYILDHVKQTFAEDLKRHRVEDIWVSEGLSKGAYSPVEG